MSSGEGALDVLLCGSKSNFVTMFIGWLVVVHINCSCLIVDGSLLFCRWSTNIDIRRGGCVQNGSKSPSSIKHPPYYNPN